MQYKKRNLKAPAMTIYSTAVLATKSILQIVHL